MIHTFDLFAADDASRQVATTEAADDRHRASWRLSWGWEGPAVGGMCSIDTPVVDRAAGGSIYAYMEKARLLALEPDGRWRAVIEMGEVRGQPWWKDGIEVLLSIRDIWPPVDDIRAARAPA